MIKGEILESYLCGFIGVYGFVCIYLELGDELLLTGDVRGEDERADVALELGLELVGELIGDAALEETADSRSPMMVFQNGGIL